MRACSRSGRRRSAGVAWRVSGDASGDVSGVSDANNIEAKKGLGYTYLIAQNAEAAILVFNNLIKDFPNEAEYRVGLGQAYLIGGKTKKARQTFEYALSLDQDNDNAKIFLNHARTKASVLERMDKSRGARTIWLATFTAVLPI